jgi:predicted negative regulator of RcsB-dependent stress response
METVGIFRTPQIVDELYEPTLVERFNTASAVHGSSLQVFQDLAERLTAAESEYRAVIAEADEEITRLTALRTAALDAARKAKESATSVLDMTRGFRNE